MTLNWPDIVDDNLQAAVAAKLVDIELVMIALRARRYPARGRRR